MGPEPLARIGVFARSMTTGGAGNSRLTSLLQWLQPAASIHKRAPGGAFFIGPTERSERELEPHLAAAAAGREAPLLHRRDGGALERAGRSGVQHRDAFD